MAGPIDIVDVMTALAEPLRAVPGIKTVFVDPPEMVQAAQLPAIVMYWGAQDQPTRLEESSISGGTMWLAPIKLDLLAVARKGDTPKEFAAGNKLVTPIVDALDKPMRELMPTLAGKVDRCRCTAVNTSQVITYAGVEHYGAEFFLDTKFHRSRRVQ